MSSVPPEFVVLFRRAVVAHRAGRLHDAVRDYERALALDDRSAPAHHQLGCAKLALGDAATAVLQFEAVTALQPNDASGWNDLGLAQSALGASELALAAFERAERIAPLSGTSWMRRGYALLALERDEAARAAFGRAVELVPDDADAWNGLGLALDRVGQPRAAAAAYRTLLRLRPDSAEGFANLGKVLLDDGGLAEARACFARAVELDPRDGRCRRLLALSHNAPAEPADVQQLERAVALASAEGDRANELELRFAAAKTLEDSRRFDEAFAHLVAGNGLKRADLAYDEAAELAVLDAMVLGFPDAVMAALRAAGPPSSRPIFVFGMPRSGTTLVEQLLAAHPDVAGGGELRTLLDVSRQCFRPNAAPMTERTWKELLRTAGERYLELTDALAGTAARLTDKMPSNFALAPLIALALPGARMIHVRRAPLDTCVSCYATLFAGRSVPYAYDLGELGRYYRAYEHVMACWRPLLRAERLYEIEYESLIADFECQARRLLAFCGLAWDPAVLAFCEVRRPVHTASNVQVRQPLYATSVGRARRFEAHLAPLVAALSGYSPPPT